MTFPILYQLIGALITVAVGFLALAILCAVVDLWRKARKWERYVALFASEARAVAVLELAEQQDERMRVAMRDAA